MTLEEAVAHLVEAGFVARIIAVGECVDILGGTGVTSVENGLQLLDAPFMISCQDTDWHVTIPGPASYQTTISSARELAEVVEETCRFYGVDKESDEAPADLHEAVSRLNENGLETSGPSHGSDALIWAFSTQEEHGPVANEYGLFRHASTWVAVVIPPEQAPRLIKYSVSLMNATDAICISHQHEKT